jgi:hypothetical protein
MKKPFLTFLFTVLNLLNSIFFFTLPLFSQTFESVDTAWVRRYNGPGNDYDMASAIAVDNSGNVYVTGISTGSGTNRDYATIKYYPNGDTAWVRRYNGPGNDYDMASAIAVDNSGNVYVTGISTGSGTYRDYATIKYYPNGDTAWVRRYNGPGNEYDNALSIAVDESGNTYVTGISAQSSSYPNNWDYATIKYYPNGDTAWVKRYDGQRNENDGGWVLAIDDSGNIYVTGYAKNINAYNDYATIKYYQNGDTAWVRTYSTSGSYHDNPYAIAVDGSGNSYVTGTSRGIVTNGDYTTIKYNPTGDSLWVRSYNGTGDTADVALAIAVDDSGYVYVTGWSFGNNSGKDYTTIKYYNNGDTVWVRRYDDSGNSDDEARAIAIDDSFNVYVSGYSYSGTSRDYTTIKYYPNGEIAWVRRYDGPVNSNDEASAMVVDDSNYIYVTGGGIGNETFNDYVTIKYVQFRATDDTLRYFAYSPVDLIVTDPIGRWINKDSSLIPDATYDTTTDKNGDGDLDDIVTIPNPLIGEYIVEVKREPDADTGHYSLRVKLDGNEDRPLAQNYPIPPPDQFDTYTYQVIEYLRGDANTDYKTTVSDVVFLINYLFKGGSAPEPVYLSDVNCDGKTTVSDVVYLINYLFKNGLAPCS